MENCAETISQTATVNVLWYPPPIIGGNPILLAYASATATEDAECDTESVDDAVEDLVDEIPSV